MTTEDFDAQVEWCLENEDLEGLEALLEVAEEETKNARQDTH